MIPVNGLMFPTRTRSMRYVHRLSVSLKAPSARYDYDCDCDVFCHLYTYHTVCWRLSDRLAACTEHNVMLDVHSSCCARLCQTKYTQFRKRGRTKQYFKVYDLREGINERRKRNSKYVIFLSFATYICQNAFTYVRSFESVRLCLIVIFFF